MSVTPELSFSDPTKDCGLPLSDCSSGQLTISTLKNQLIAVFDLEQSNMAEITNYCLGNRLEALPFAAKTSLPVSLPHLPPGTYKFRLALNGLNAIEQVHLP
jgi:hypothetical protein